MLNLDALVNHMNIRPYITETVSHDVMVDVY